MTGAARPPWYDRDMRELYAAVGRRRVLLLLALASSGAFVPELDPAVVLAAVLAIGEGL